MMTADAVIADLQGAGFNSADAISRAALVRLVADRLSLLSRTPPVGVWFVPGRVEIFGKHTDYAGGRSLVAAVPRGMAVVAAPRGDRRVRVVDAHHGGEVELDPADDRDRHAGWANYAAVVARRLAANFPRAELGADVVFASDLPRAAGMSSSSALVVGIALALAARGDLEGREEWRAAIRDDLDLAGYFGAVENGTTYRTLAGARGVGTQGGSQDHTAILTSRAGHASMYRYLPAARLADVPLPDDWRFVLMTSGVHASKAGAQRDRYNRAPQAVSVLMELWRRETGDPPMRSLAAVLASRPDGARLLQTWAGRGHADFTGVELIRRLAHFVEEDARVPLAEAALRRGDRAALADLSRASQASAGADLGNQVHETMELARVAGPSGAFAASSFGAGFGGSVWALVEGDGPACHRTAIRWRDAYVAACPHVHGVQWFVTRPGPPVVHLS